MYTYKNRMSKSKTEFARKLRKQPTPSEAYLWRFLRNRQLNGWRFTRQRPMFGYIVDFYCPNKRAIIEIDGPYHKYNKKQDDYRDSVFRSHGVYVLRFESEAVLENIEDILLLITQSLDKLPTY